MDIIHGNRMDVGPYSLTVFFHRLRRSMSEEVPATRYPNLLTEREFYYNDYMHEINVQ